MSSDCRPSCPRSDRDDAHGGSRSPSERALGVVTASAFGLLVAAFAGRAALDRRHRAQRSRVDSLPARPIRPTP